MVYETILSQVPFFSDLPSDTLAGLSERFHRRHFGKDQVIFHKDDVGSTLYIIMAGKVKIVLPSAEGENVIVAILSTGDFFGELSLFDGEPRSATAISTDSSEILTLDQEDFIRYIKANPDASIAILSELSLRLRRTDELLSDTAFCNLSIRLTKRLLELADRYGQKGDAGEVRINLKLRQQDLADMVGATRESVNKMLRSFQKKNLLQFDKGFITILDSKELTRQAR